MNSISKSKYGYAGKILTIDLASRKIGNLETADYTVFGWPGAGRQDLLEFNITENQSF
jgi:hypothetical protein